jgi:hypothetical protein
MKFIQNIDMEYFWNTVADENGNTKLCKDSGWNF